MPTLFKLFGLIFRIYTRDHCPPHVHVISQEGEAIFTVSEDGVEMRENKGMRQKTSACRFLSFTKTRN